jgi:hypothetical protein
VTATRIFISYVHEDRPAVDRLVDALAGSGIDVWIDHERLQPGQRWRDEIRNGIRGGGGLIACFSAASVAKERSYMNEELIEAIEEVRMRPRTASWLYPVRLDDVRLPDLPIGAGERLGDLQYVDLWGDFDLGVSRLISRIASAPPTA